MGAQQSNDDDDIISSINVTPLVDITLVLLIIFMVTATYIVTPSIKIELPKAINSEQSSPSTAAIVINQDGRLFLNTKEMGEETLIKEIKSAYGVNQDIQVIISADKQVRHGVVVHIIDVVRGAGVSKFAISIEKDQL